MFSQATLLGLKPQISGQLCSSAALQALSEADSASPSKTDVLLQLLALAFSAAGNAAILMTEDATKLEDKPSRKQPASNNNKKA